MDRQSAVHRFAAAWADGVDLPPAGCPPPPGGLDERTLRWCGQIISLLLALAEETAEDRAAPAQVLVQVGRDTMIVRHRKGALYPGQLEAFEAVLASVGAVPSAVEWRVARSSYAALFQGLERACLCSRTTATRSGDEEAAVAPTPPDFDDDDDDGEPAPPRDAEPLFALDWPALQPLQAQLAALDAAIRASVRLGGYLHFPLPDGSGVRKVWLEGDPQALAALAVRFLQLRAPGVRTTLDFSLSVEAGEASEVCRQRIAQTSGDGTQRQDPGHKAPVCFGGCGADEGELCLQDPRRGTAEDTGLGSHRAQAEATSLRPLGGAGIVEAINAPPGFRIRRLDDPAQAPLHAERQAALQRDLADLGSALGNLAQLDPTDPQKNEQRAAEVALSSLWGTLHRLGLLEEASAATNAPPHAERQAALQQDPDALPEARLQEIQSVHHRSGPDEDPDHDTRAHCHRGELLEEVQRLKKRLCQAQQQHLDDLQRTHDHQAQVFGELRGVVTNLEAQLADERARNERLMDRYEALQDRLTTFVSMPFERAARGSAPGPTPQVRSARAPTEDK